MGRPAGRVWTERPGSWPNLFESLCAKEEKGIGMLGEFLLSPKLRKGEQHKRLETRRSIVNFFVPLQKHLDDLLVAETLSLVPSDLSSLLCPPNNQKNRPNIYPKFPKHLQSPCQLCFPSLQLSLLYPIPNP